MFLTVSFVLPALNQRLTGSEHRMEIKRQEEVKAPLASFVVASTTGSSAEPESSRPLSDGIQAAGHLSVRVAVKDNGSVGVWKVLEIVTKQVLRAREARLRRAILYCQHEHALLLSDATRKTLRGRHRSKKSRRTTTDKKEATAPPSTSKNNKNGRRTRLQRANQVLKSAADAAYNACFISGCALDTCSCGIVAVRLWFLSTDDGKKHSAQALSALTTSPSFVIQRRFFHRRCLALPPMQPLWPWISQPPSWPPVSSSSSSSSSPATSSLPLPHDVRSSTAGSGSTIEDRGPKYWSDRRDRAVYASGLRFAFSHKKSPCDACRATKLCSQCEESGGGRPCLPLSQDPLAS